MTDPEEAADGRWSLWSRTQRTAIEWLAVIISILGFLTNTLIAIAAATMAGVALYVANESSDDSKIYGIYVQALHADLKAKGFEPPPLPEEEK